MRPHMEFCANGWCYMEKNKTTVYLGGTEFKLKISESEEYIQGLAAYVNSQIASVQNQYVHAYRVINIPMPPIR